MPETDPKAFVDVHVISENLETIQKIKGNVYWLTESKELGDAVCEGDVLHRDAVLFLEAGAMLEFDRGCIHGGKRGKTHSFVDPDSIRDRPGRADVPRLLLDLEALKQKSELDPLEKKFRIKTEFQLIAARDFAIQNLDIMAARSLPERTARDLDIVCLFLSGETACVAMAEVNLLKVHQAMTALKRPIKPHLIDTESMTLLLDKIYL